MCVCVCVCVFVFVFVFVFFFLSFVFVCLFVLCFVFLFSFFPFFFSSAMFCYKMVICKSTEMSIIEGAKTSIMKYFQEHLGPNRKMSQYA